MFQIALFKGFPDIPHIPYLPNTQLAEMRQQGQQPAKTQKVGRIPVVPERYTYKALENSLYFCWSLYKIRIGQNENWLLNPAFSRAHKCYITPALSGIPKQRGTKSELAA